MGSGAVVDDVVNLVAQSPDIGRSLLAVLRNRHTNNRAGTLSAVPALRIAMPSGVGILLSSSVTFSVTSFRLPVQNRPSPRPPPAAGGVERHRNALTVSVVSPSTAVQPRRALITASATLFCTTSRGGSPRRKSRCSEAVTVGPKSSKTGSVIFSPSAVRPPKSGRRVVSHRRKPNCN